MAVPEKSAPPDPNAAAAHHFLTELRTRITTQPLPYQHGIEARALESLWEVFGHARAAMQKYPGCARFSSIVTQMLNLDLRPVTAKWHRAHAEGRLNSRDGADEFRADLAAVQLKLRSTLQVLSVMAYGTEDADQLTPPVMSPEALEEVCFPVPFGLSTGQLIPDPMVARINATEAAEIAARRGAHRIDTTAGVNAFGLALSGGGIRSATFALGVIQVLADRRMLRHVDFLSTVSGGGYTGCFLTTRLGLGLPEAEVANPDGPDPAPIRYLRHHAKYLTSASLWQSWSMVCATLAGMLLNWSAPVLLIVGLALAKILISRTLPGVLDRTAALSLSAALTALALIAYGWRMRCGPQASRRSGWTLAVLMALTLGIFVSWMHAMITMIPPASWPATWVLPGMLASLVVAAPAVIRFVPVRSRPALRRAMLKLALILAGLIVPALAVALFHAALFLGSLDAAAKFPAWCPLHYVSGIILLGIAAVILAIVANGLLNINLTAPHRLYRDMLAVTFVQRSEADDTPLPITHINPGTTAPYHLVNATVNLPANKNPALRDRKSDFFLFSKHWCGSPVTDYHATSAWRTDGNPIDLATAMAISGAAASSYMGLRSMPTLVALLTFLNLRLGFWLRRPDRRCISSAPGFLRLLQEMTGIGMSEKGPWFNLSDGGHIENMGAYELLRRRCKFIVCVDGEADPDYTFPGLMTLVRHAQLDFGIAIDLRLNNLRPDPVTGRCQTHATLGRIRYPATADGRPQATGLFLYVKLSLTGNESELIQRYRTINLEFPHQPTLDQFFGEEQFEAYRQLGVHEAEGLFSRALMFEPWRPEPERLDPVDVADWFRRLARNLLEPSPA